MSKTVYEKIRDAQRAGTFEGTMLAQGKSIRYFDDEYFETHSREQIAQQMNQEEYEYYHPKIDTVAHREKLQKEQDMKKTIDDRRDFVEGKKEWAVSECMKKIKHLPQPIRPDEGRIRSDIGKIVGNPFMNDDSWVEKLNEYVGIVSTGEVPVISIRDSKEQFETKE